jgi:hypothetical protein
LWSTTGCGNLELQNDILSFESVSLAESSRTRWPAHVSASCVVTPPPGTGAAYVIEFEVNVKWLMPTSFSDLRGRVVLITGGSRGLGREMASAAARCAADLVIASRDYDSCAATAAEIEQATGRMVLPYAVHVGRWDQLDGLVASSFTTGATLRSDGVCPDHTPHR